MDSGLSDDAAANRELLAMMAVHELRRSLHGVLAFVSVVQHERAGPLSAMQLDFLSSAMLSARRMERFITDLQLALAADTLPPVTCECFDLRELLDRCARESHALAEAHAVRLAVDTDGRPPIVWADPARVEQMVFNLLENAFRHAPPQTTVRLRARASSSRVLCTVVNRLDDPVDADSSRWFNPYERGAHGNDGSAGWGLGLTIVRQLAQVQSGRTVGRVANGAATFGFTLPMRPPEPDDPVPTRRYDPGRDSG